MACYFVTIYSCFMTTSSPDHSKQPLPKPNLRNPIHLLAFGLGSGTAPKAPGTFGTFAALPFWFFLLQSLPAIPYLAITLLSFIIGVWLCQKTSDDLGVHDHGGIVWDEWVGVWITLFMLPSGTEYDWIWLVAGVTAFRFFDIIKPWPIKWLDQKVDGGFGIMIDDVIAGIFAWCVIQGAAWLII